jgi:hypothetical protein
MGLKRPIVHDWPIIDVKSLPLIERKAAAHLQNVLFHFSYYYHEFRAAVELYDHSNIEGARASLTDAESWAQDWMSLAARDGAMTIYHFGEALKALGTCFKDCPTLRKHIDHDALRSARKLMEKYFPHRRTTMLSWEFCRQSSPPQSERCIHQCFNLQHRRCNSTRDKGSYLIVRLASGSLGLFTLDPL